MCRPGELLSGRFFLLRTGRLIIKKEYRYRAADGCPVMCVLSERSDQLGNLFHRILDSIFDAFSAIFNVGVRLKYVLALLLLFAGGTAAFTYTKMMNSVGGKTDYEEAQRYIQLKDLIEERFISPVDRSGMTDSASASIVNGLGDKWSYYMTPDEYKSYQLYSSNDYSDIGMSMIKYSGGGFQVVSVTPGTPAGNSGLTSGMVITAIDGESVLNSDIDYVRVLIRSRMNTSFKVTVNGKEEYTINCSTMYVSPVKYRLEKTLAGYIQIKNFEAGSGDDAVKAIEDLLSQKAVALCIDVRGNSGGLANEVATLLDYLLPSGDMFYQVDKSGNKTVKKSDAMSLQLPMVVLIDSNTYGEAELFAAVLQEHGWAIIMGDATTGMTRTQETFELADGSAVRLSTKTYVTARGLDLAESGGVIPDTIIHNSDPNTVGTTEGTLGDSNGTASSSDDEQLMAALKYLS